MRSSERPAEAEMSGPVTCPLCGQGGSESFATARDYEYFTDEREYEYRRCPSCDVVFLADPPVDRLHEIYPATYYSYGGERSSFADRVKQRLDARLLRRLLRGRSGPKLRVLDVGGGSGWLLSVARQVSDRVTETHEVDIDAGAREMAEADGHIFHECTIEEFSDDGAFDLVIMLNLIEHVADPRRVLTSVRRHLSDDGRILVKTPNFDTWDCRRYRDRYWGGFHCPRHFVLFNRGSLETLVDECGLRVDRFSYTQGAPQWTASVMAGLFVRGRLDISAERPMPEHPLYMPLNAAFAGLDFARRPFAPTAQMFAELAPA